MLGNPKAHCSEGVRRPHSSGVMVVTFVRDEPVSYVDQSARNPPFAQRPGPSTELHPGDAPSPRAGCGSGSLATGLEVGGGGRWAPAGATECSAVRQRSSLLPVAGRGPGDRVGAPGASLAVGRLGWSARRARGPDQPGVSGARVGLPSQSRNNPAVVRPCRASGCRGRQGNAAAWAAPTSSAATTTTQRTAPTPVGPATSACRLGSHGIQTRTTFRCPQGVVTRRRAA